MVSRTGKEAEEEKGMFRVHEGSIPTGTSANTNYLPLFIHLLNNRGGPEHLSTAIVPIL